MGRVLQQRCWAPKKMRIRKSEFITRGGLTNPHLFRKMQGGVWTYWKGV